MDLANDGENVVWMMEELASLIDLLGFVCCSWEI
jgi:hypothetical protein